MDYKRKDKKNSIKIAFFIFILASFWGGNQRISAEEFSQIKGEQRIKKNIVKNIVSLNLCTDQILLSLEPLFKEERVTNLAANCFESPFCKEAHFVSTLPKNKEELWVNPPSLILESSFMQGAPEEERNLRHIPFYYFKNIDKLEEIPQETRELGRLIGREEAAEKISAAFDARLKMLLSSQDLTEKRTAVIIGMEDNRLLEEIVEKSGFKILHVPKSLEEEYLLKNPPDLLIINLLGEGVSLKEDHVFTPILQKYFPGFHHLIIRAGLSLCGNSAILDLLEDIIAAHENLKKG